MTENMDYWVLGVSHKSCALEDREMFSLGEEARRRLLSSLVDEGFQDVLILSTCNRTEVFGLGGDLDRAYELFLTATGVKDERSKWVHRYSHLEAVNYFLRVAVGLESQILGDFEIIAQIKKAYAESKKNGAVTGKMERLVNSSIQASKQIRTETALSSGATSVAYAATHYIKSFVPDFSEKSIALVGTGKIGQTTCDNLLKHVSHRKLTLVNRSFEKAEKLAEKYHVHARSLKDLEAVVQESEVVVVATGADQYTLDKSLRIPSGTKRWFIDLSVPRNVDPDLNSEETEVISMDELNSITKETMQNRQSEVPAAEEILNHHLNEFLDWMRFRKASPILKAVRNHLEGLSPEEKSALKSSFDGAMGMNPTNTSRLDGAFAAHLKSEPKEFETRLKQLEHWVGEQGIR